jgi:hypothetical protein
MAVPTETKTLDSIATTTVEHRIPELVDQIYTSNPLFVRLYNRNKMMIQGGLDIRQPILYKKGLAGAYKAGEVFSTEKQDSKTEMRFDWKLYVSPVTIDEWDSLRNSGVYAVIDNVASELDVAEMDLADDMGDDLHSDGSGGGGGAINGLVDAIDDSTNTSTYGGISYSSTTDDPGQAIKANVDSTGGAFSLALVGSEFTNATVGPEKPDLIVTTPSIWDSFEARVQPAQRYVQDGRNFKDLADIGCQTLNYRGAAVVADSKVPSQVIWGINSKYFKFVTHRARDYVFRGWFPIHNQDAMTGQFLAATNLICQAPRLQFKVESVT